MTTPQDPVDQPLAPDPGWDDERLAAAFVARAGGVVVPTGLVPVTLERLRPAVARRTWAGRLLPLVAGIALVIGVLGGGIVLLAGPGGLIGSGVTFRDGPSSDLRTLDAGSFALDFPAEWHAAATSGAVGSGGSIIAVLTSQAIEDRCDGVGGVDINCVYEQPLEPGQVRIFVGTSGYRGGTIFDRVEIENGTTTRLAAGGMPAILDEFDVTPEDYYRADRWATWQIATPSSLSTVVRLEFMASDPDAAASRAAAEAMVASFRFTPPPTPLPDDLSLGVVAGRAALDADAASFRRGFVSADDNDGKTYLDCLAPVPGEDRVMDVGYGPGGDLGRSVLTRCRWFVTPVRNQPFWQLATVYEWQTSDEVGWYGERYYLDATGAVVARSSSGEGPPARPETTPEPSTLVLPSATPMGVWEAITIRDAGPDGRELAVRGWFSPIGPLSCPYTPAASPIQPVCPDPSIVLMEDPESLVTVLGDGFEGREPTGRSFQLELDDLDTSWVPALPTVGPAAPIEIVVVGHFDDRRSFACPEVQVCRDRFVVDQVRTADGRTRPFSVLDYVDAGAAASVEAIRTLVTSAVPGTTILSMVAVNGADMERIEPNIMAFVPFQEERAVWVVRTLDPCRDPCGAGVVGAPQTFVVVDATNRVFAFDDRQVARQIAGARRPGPIVIELRSPVGAGRPPARVTVVDPTGAVAAAREVEPSDRPMGGGDVFARDPDVDGRYRLSWIGSICDGNITVTIEPDVARIVVDPGTRPACDSMGVDRELVLDLSRSVDTTGVELVVLPASLVDS